MLSLGRSHRLRSLGKLEAAMAREDDSAAKRWMGMFALGSDDEDMASGELNYHPQTGINLRTLERLKTEYHQPREPRQYPALKGLIEGARPCTILRAFDINIGGGRLEPRQIVGHAILLDGYCNDPGAPAYRRIRFRSSAFTALVGMPIGTRAVGAGTTLGPCMTWGFVAAETVLGHL
jgi:hypothetical protein